MNFFSEDDKSALQAKEYAQWIAFAPVVFQVSRILRESGILKLLQDAKTRGLSMDEIHENSKLHEYGVRILVEGSLGIGLSIKKDEKYFLTKAGHFILNDQLTKVNMDFVQDVCYDGLLDLDKAIYNKKPEGLQKFGKWNTLYEALAYLPPQVRKSWLDFDHYYSDISFHTVLPDVLHNGVETLLDIGGNTGKWAAKCIEYSNNVHVTIMDLPGQMEMAKKTIKSLDYEDRVSFYQMDILKENSSFPKGFDVIWMSQFLDCFSDEQIVSILKRCSDALNDDGVIWILELFWDRQRFKVASFCLQMTSFYFTTIANGNSQMYDSNIFLNLIKEAGLTVEEEFDNIGVGHTLLKCRKNGN